MRNILISIGAIACLQLTLFGQCPLTNEYLRVGDTIENYTFTELVNYPQKTVSIDHFRGLWLIIDTWTPGCTSCIASFPKMDTLQAKYKDKVKIIMAGAMKFSDKSHALNEKRTKSLYAHLDKKYRFQLTVAFDTVLYMKYGMSGVPHILIIDPVGVVKAITTSVSEPQLLSLFKGETPLFSPYQYLPEGVGYNTSLPFLTNGEKANGGTDTNYLFRSILSESTEQVPAAAITRLYGKRMANFSQGRIEVFHYSLNNLYWLAYFGLDSWDIWDDREYNTLSEKLILALDDTVSYEIANEKLYTYSLSVPRGKSNAEYLMSIMRSDLKNYFGYNASVVAQEVPVFVVETGDWDKVNSLASNATDKEHFEYSYDHLKLVNQPIDVFIKHLSFLLKLNLPIYNDTGFNNRINLELKGNMLDEEDILRQVSKLGFRIVKAAKRLQAIKLSDK